MPTSHKKDIWKPPVEFSGFNPDTFIIYDTEYTTWEGALERGWSGENEYREIVQIGAIKVRRETLEIIDTLDIYLRPRINSVLSDFFVQLTGITNEKIEEEGIDFVEATEKFGAFGHQQIAYSYGNDMVHFGENMALYDLHPMPNLGIYFANIAPFFRIADPATNTVNSGHLAQHFGVPLGDEHQEHNALADCYSILKAMTFLVHEKGMALPF